MQKLCELKRLGNVTIEIIEGPPIIPDEFAEKLFKILKDLEVAPDTVSIDVYENPPGESEAIKVIPKYDKDACTFPEEFPQKLREDLCALDMNLGNVTLEIFAGPPPDKTILRSTRSMAKKLSLIHI